MRLIQNFAGLGWLLLFSVAAGAQGPGNLLILDFTPVLCHQSLAESAVAINNSGGIIGSCGQSGRTFYQVNGSTQIIGVPGSSFTEATAVNNKGDIVGYYQDRATHLQHGFLLSGGSFTQIDPPGTSPELIAINDSGEIVGMATGVGIDYAIPFVYQNGTFTEVTIPGSKFGSTVVSGIDNNGDLVGSYSTSDGNPHGFLLQAGVVTNIDVPVPGALTYPYSINNSGVIVGVYNVNGFWRGFFYSNGVFQGFILRDGFSLAGDAYVSINDFAQIVGDYAPGKNGDGKPYGYLAQLPLP